jgi:hypothetical protein
MSPLRRVLKEFAADIEGARKTDLEIIYPFLIHPVIGNPFEDIKWSHWTCYCIA